MSAELDRATDGLYEVPGSRLRELRQAEADRDRYRSMLGRIRALGGKLWDGYDCATAAITTLDGEVAGRTHAMARDELHDS